MATNNRLTLSRAQLATFLKDPEQIRQFERLFAIVGNQTDVDTQSIEIQAGIAEAAAGVISNVVTADYLDFSPNPKHADKPRRVAWNDNDDTLNIHHTGGVTQQVGLEMYVRFYNSTGVTIPNGTVVGIDYVGGVTTDDVVPFISDGTVPMLNIVGVTTQDVLNGGYGRATVFGLVREIDTTGTPYGEVWAQGDALYASPTIPGGFTNAKPTAPAWCIPTALVLFADAALGQIFVRPTIDQPLYYAEIVKTTDTTPAVINTAYPVEMDSVNIGNGVTIGTPTSRIVADVSGLYRFSVSLQMASGSASVKNAWFFFRKNGVDIANSSTIVSIDSGTAIVSPSVDILVSLDSGDYVELVWAADNVNVTLNSTAATAFAPASPAVIMVVSQEQQ